MRGSIQKRGKASWRLKFDLPPGPDGKRRTRFLTVRGGKKDAQQKLAELLASLGKGIYVSPSRASVADHVRTRIDLWSTSGVIGAKTTKRYGVLLDKQISPHLGDTALQRLSTGLFGIRIPKVGLL